MEAQQAVTQAQSWDGGLHSRLQDVGKERPPTHYMASCVVSFPVGVRSELPDTGQDVLWDNEGASNTREAGSVGQGNLAEHLWGQWANIGLSRYPIR